MSGECEAPQFCFTGDLDWAPESMVDEVVSFFNGEGIPFTPFITHRSESIERNYGGGKDKYVGLHPNFVFDTTHGKNMGEIVSNCIQLWPTAKCFRSHYYVDSLLINQHFYNWGFKYDSNMCLLLKENIVPQSLVSGLFRFPVFFEDILYVDKVGTYDLEHIRDRLLSGGLKIFNIHPMHFCINTPTLEHYTKNKHELYLNEKWEPHIFGGRGIRTLITDIVDFIKEEKMNTFYLEELYQTHRKNHEDVGLSPFFMKKTLGDSR